MVTRRNFLRIGGSLIALSVAGNSVKAAEDFEGNPDRLGMLSDMTRCIGCRRCEAACNKANKLSPPKTSFEDTSVFEEKRKPYVADVQSYTAVNRYEVNGKTVYRKVQCMHCDEPACASACPVGALKKSPEGPVTWNDKVCIGCRYCIIACPFYVPAFEYSSAFDPKIQKCFMCYQNRITKGIIPACAEACPVEAITFGKRSDLIKQAWLRIWDNPDKYIDHIYGEHEAGGTGWLYISGVPFSQLDFQMDIGTTSYPKYTKDFLSMVNLTLVSWPALLGGFYLASRRSHTAHDEKPDEEVDEQ
ncbi:4Fe-4S dicluster domain-containing protein [Candidatus Methanoperedens nitratireducens]|uniref:Protein DVU_0535 n=1 Tax=Candidatus Methanoperedens nitratireducens TaxID=1392998 RepID=A0A284VN44_9EURY|nr:4Fe-4S dicluster domain-containing protein [Candidatus Methanoperedens nitroreducens]SNQ60629.1 Protein DVU_0535 [Candidatus Methanoperedens nitroreducens]